MFQWDAVDTTTSPDLGGQDVVKTFEIAIRYNTRTTRMELEFFLSLDLFLLTFINIFSGPLTGEGGDRPPPTSPMDPPLVRVARRS